MYNMDRQEFIKSKKERREKKRTCKRDITPEDVIFIFEKVLEGWKTIRIYNTMIQLNNKSKITKKKVEVISSGNSKIYESETSPDRYEYYKTLRERVYEVRNNMKYT